MIITIELDTTLDALRRVPLNERLDGRYARAQWLVKNGVYESRVYALLDAFGR